MGNKDWRKKCSKGSLSVVELVIIDSGHEVQSLWMRGTSAQILSNLFCNNFYFFIATAVDSLLLKGNTSYLISRLCII